MSVSAADIIGGILAGALIAGPVFGIVVWLWYMDERHWR